MGGGTDLSRSASPASRTIHWVAVAVAVIVAIILPAGYFATSIQYLSGEMQSEAEFTAGAVSRLVNANPQMWQFQAHHLDRALAGDRPHDIGTRRVFLVNGVLVAEHVVQSLANPTIRRRAPVFDAGIPVGTVEVEDTIEPVLVRTGAVALLGFGLGATVFVVLRVLPLRALRRSEEALRRSEERIREAQKMEAIGLLAGGVAHDFNSLLTVIIGRAVFVLEDATLSPPARQNVEKIRVAAERVATLTYQLLALGRRQTLQLRVVDLNTLMVHATPLLRSIVGPAIHLEMAETAGLWPISVDPEQIERVLSNLARNARDAMPSGGRLRIETTNIEARTLAAAEPDAQPAWDSVRLRVQDSGVGIAPEVLARIFEPFFTTRAFGTGAGLGLAVVDGIIRQHQGTIRVRSAPGDGATFDLYIPRASAPA